MHCKPGETPGPHCVHGRVLPPKAGRVGASAGPIPAASENATRDRRGADLGQSGADAMTALAVIPVVPEIDSLVLATEQARIESYVRQSRAKSTLRGYRSDWREFEAWC